MTVPRRRLPGILVLVASLLGALPAVAQRDLHRLGDFNGTYWAATGEATLGNGFAGQFLKNGQAVELRIDDGTRGARLSGSADGIQLEIIH